MTKITIKKCIFSLVLIIVIFSSFIFNLQSLFDDIEEEVVEDLECRKRISDTRKFLRKENLKFDCNALDSDNCGQNYKRF